MASKFEKDVYENFSSIDEKFNKIDEFKQDVCKNFKRIDERFNKNDVRMDNFEQDMKEMKKDISNMQTDISNMKKDISFMKDDMSFMQKTMISMQNTMENMNKSIILIEHKVTTEIPALFDGYSMHQEKQDHQQEDIDSLNVKVEEHDIRISCLEQTNIKSS